MVEKSTVKIDGFTELYYEGKNITYVLNCLLDKHLSPDKELVSMQLVQDYGMAHEKELDGWDNPSWLVTTLYHEVLTPWVIDKKIINGEEFADLLKSEGVALEDFEGIWELFNKAKQLNMIEL